MTLAQIEDEERRLYEAGMKAYEGFVAEELVRLLQCHPMTTPKKSRSGTSRGQAARMASGRPITSFTLSLEAREIIGQLAEHYNLSRSAVVELAVRELQKKMR